MLTSQDLDQIALLFKQVFEKYTENILEKFRQQDKRIDTKFAQQNKRMEEYFSQQKKLVQEKFEEQDTYIKTQFTEQKLYIDVKFSELSHQLLQYTNIIYDNHDKKIIDHDKRLTRLESPCVNDK